MSAKFHEEHKTVTKLWLLSDFMDITTYHIMDITTYHFMDITTFKTLVSVQQKNKAFTQPQIFKVWLWSKQYHDLWKMLKMHYEIFPLVTCILWNRTATQLRYIWPPLSWDNPDRHSAEINLTATQLRYIWPPLSWDKPDRHSAEINLTATQLR